MFLLDIITSSLVAGAVSQYSAGLKMGRKFIYGAAMVAGVVAAVITPW